MPSSIASGLKLLIFLTKVLFKTVRTNKLDTYGQSSISNDENPSVPNPKYYTPIPLIKIVVNQGMKFISGISWITTIAITTIASPLLIVSLGQAQPSKPQPIFENVTIRPNFSPDPLTIRGISGGSVAATKVGGRVETPTGPCVGFVDQQPDHTIELKAFFNYLSLQVQSPEDTTMVITGPGGTWCSDDAQGKNPGIAGQWRPGTYRVWIGSYEQDNYHPYIIRISEVQLLNPGPSRR